MAGITKSPQLRLSPETAKDHVAGDGWTNPIVEQANETSSVKTEGKSRGRGNLNMATA
ncbi:MAG: hypothetical protein ACLP00_30960 [Terracidiphilus sp.]